MTVRSGSAGPRLALVALLLSALATVGADADPTTTCAFGGPVSGFGAMTVDLPEGTDLLQLSLAGRRSATRPPNTGDGWHLAEGIAVIDAASHEIMAYQVLYVGTAAPVVAVESDGQTVVNESVTGPEGPWIHSTRNVRPDLPPGSYHVVAFGTGGPESGLYAQKWGASIYLAGSHRCHGGAAGETFDFDQTAFRGGTQVYAAGVGMGEGLGLEFETDRPLVFGLMDAGVQGGDSGQARLDYATPGGSGTLERQIVPFVSTAGSHRFAASYQGVHPIVAVTGVALEIPKS